MAISDRKETDDEMCGEREITGPKLTRYSVVCA